MSAACSRRHFLAAAAQTLAGVSLIGSSSAARAASDVPARGASSFTVIDTHTHFYDPTRAQGVPWPPHDDKLLYRQVLPRDYRALPVPRPVNGTVVVEASPWLEDNQWVLDLAAREPFIVGFVGNLLVGTKEFAGHLKRFAVHKLFRGIRLRDRKLEGALDDPAFVNDLKLLAEAGLALDTANPTPRLLADLVRLSDRVPPLRIVIDHLPALDRPSDTGGQASYDASLKALAQPPPVYVKVSEVLRRAKGAVAFDAAVYRPKLEEIYGTFGPDRLLFGSDWPNSDPFGTYGQVLGVVCPFFLAKGRGVAAKFFWKNSVTAYRWAPREPGQPQLA